MCQQFDAIHVFNTYFQWVEPQAERMLSKNGPIFAWNAGTTHTHTRTKCVTSVYFSTKHILEDSTSNYTRHDSSQHPYVYLECKEWNQLMNRFYRIELEEFNTRNIHGNISIYIYISTHSHNKVIILFWQSFDLRLHTTYYYYFSNSKQNTKTIYKLINIWLVLLVHWCSYNDFSVCVCLCVRCFCFCGLLGTSIREAWACERSSVWAVAIFGIQYLFHVYDFANGKLSDQTATPTTLSKRHTHTETRACTLTACA